MKQFIYIAFIFSCSFAFADDQGKEPPALQQTPRFNLKFPNRQPKPPAYLSAGIKNLEKKKRAEWNQSDSLYYAIELVYLANYESALLYFLGVNTDTVKEPHASQLYQLTLRNKQRYSLLRDAVEQSQDNDDVKKIRLRLIDVREKVENQKWSISDSVIFPFLSDSIIANLKKSKSNYSSDFFAIAENVKSALAYEVILHDQRDVILSNAFEEFGDFLGRYVYISSGYISYSIARYFDKRNASLAKKLKESKKSLDEHNYLIPSLRNSFSKIRPEFYNFQTYSDYIPIDTTQLEIGSKLEDLLKFDKKPDRLSNWDMEVLVIICLFLVLIGVLIFVKSRK